MRLHELIKQICENNHYEYKDIDNDYLIKLCKNEKEIIIKGACFPINNETSAKIVRDKAMCSKILLSYNIPCVNHKYYNKKETLLLEQIETPIVIKPCKSYGGKIFISAITKNNLFQLLKIFHQMNM